MIKVSSIDYLDEATKQAKVFIESDTKSEVTPSAEILGMPEGYTIAPFSKLLTTSKELAVMKSDGTWNWGDE